MKKILFVATVGIHFRFFYLPYFELFTKSGWEVSSACSGSLALPTCDNKFEISIDRSPLSFNNITAYRQLKRIIQKNKFDIIHCNNPVGGVLARIASRTVRKQGTKVIYTAHGFHFFMGAPLKNWLIYYPIEYFMSKITDCLITINHEDYSIAKKYFKSREIVHVHGVGYDDEKFFKSSSEKKNELRYKNGYADSDILLVYVAELNKNKNQKLLIQAFEIICAKNQNVRLLLIGHDGLNGKNQRLSEKLGLENKIDFWGMRTDVEDLLPMCDIAVASSIREGLPVNVMEALACGIPVVAFDNRGHRELVKNETNGYLIKPNDINEFAQRVLEIIENEVLHQKLSKNAIKNVVPFSRNRVIVEMRSVYEKVMSFKNDVHYKLSYEIDQ